MTAPDRLVTTKQLGEIVPFSRTHIWRLVKAGKFPAPIRIGENRVAWRLSTVEEWIDARESGGDHDEAA